MAEMKNKIKFDHAFTLDKNHKFLKSLHKAGFLDNKATTLHPGAKCKFIYFDNYKYLEFVHQTDKKLYNIPGISFNFDGKLENLYKKYVSKKIKCRFAHKNYEWMKNSKDHLPGWNFISFTHTGVKEFYPWFTEYEDSEKRKKKKRSKKVSNKNGVNQVLGHVFTLNTKGRKIFDLIFNLKNRKSYITPDGITLYFKDGKNNKYESIVLKSKNLNKTKKYLKQSNSLKCIDGEFLGKSAIHIKNPHNNKKMWEIIVV
jgi:hypothetical protein